MSELAPNENALEKPAQLDRVDALELENKALKAERAALLVNQAQMTHAKASEDLEAAKAAIRARYQLAENDTVYTDGRIERAK